MIRKLLVTTSLGLLTLGAGCAQSVPTAGGPAAPALGQPAAGYDIQQRGNEMRRPGLNRRNRLGVRRPNWWGTHRWERRGIRPTWWGTVPLNRSRFVVVNGYYYPFYVYGGSYYPDYTEPYTYYDGRFFAATEAPMPAQHAYDQITPNRAVVVNVNQNELSAG